MPTVLTNNPPTPRHSSNIPQTTSGTKPGPSGVQQQNTTGTRSLDEAVDQILMKAKSPLGEGEVRRVVETLEKMLDHKYPITMRTRRRCFRGLVKVCGEYGILPNSYIIQESDIEKLGESPVSSGGFSDVWPGMHEGEKSVAIKIIRYYESDDVQTIKKDFCREVITWKRLSHPNVLELIGVMMNDKEYVMVSPWMENRNIVDYLRKSLQTNPLKLLEDAACGLQYLHGVDLAHGDLKGGNILVSEDGRVCLADVGLTRIAGDLGSTTATSHTSTINGASTLRWCPPELLDPERFGSKRSSPTKKSDIYSMAMTVYEVLTDRIPFYEYKDLVAMLHIIQGVRPKKPIFAITRGYTEELWAMTTSCWEENPTERPTVDYVLEALKMAAEQWKPKHGGLSILSPSDDWSPTPSAEDSDSSESEDEPFMANVSPSLNPPQPHIVETPVPTPPPLSPALTPFVPLPSTTKIEEPPEMIRTTSEKEEIQPVLIRPPKEEEPRSISVTSREEGVKPVLVSLPREEEHKSISAISRGTGIWPVPVGPSREEEPKSTHATSKREDIKPVHVRPPKEEPRPIPATPKETKHSPVDLSQAQSNPIPLGSRKDEVRKAVLPKPIPVIPEEVNPVPINSRTEVLFEPTPATTRKEMAGSTSASPPKRESPSKSTPATSLGVKGAEHTPINPPKEKVRSEPMLTTEEEGARNVSSKPTLIASSKEQEAKSTIVGSSGEAPLKLSEPASKQGETGPAPTDSQRVGPERKEVPAEHEANPSQYPVHVRRAHPGQHSESFH
ncbi:kinase-like protein [Thelephora ganbajun]|uniref:Kinase-like protein n=1 Tax=Thelephora ganbajun TaxID=370292 RepID=A0ACB6ZXC1_THEGA|nr:kinase-like protein [Thelephora ganbajun]